MKANEERESKRRAGASRKLSRKGAMLLAALLSAILLSACGTGQTSVFQTAPVPAESADPDVSKVPWDYRIVEGTVGDLIGSDMTILPDQELLPNDDNYATGERIWTLQFMDAELTTNSEGQNKVRLSAWQTIKTNKSKEAAEKDLAELKISVSTEVDLVGVYQTELQGVTREFAVLTLPSGNQIKQPIDKERYNRLKTQKKAQVRLEEIHDYADYDLAYAKFRGWED